ncbi:MAG: helix-turn-helix domain-containing protein [Jaaginema sp. PMC 1079.18]|nr:helix-turn-helix domain-containing protein [Jaaginema sp. PMC 1080.18]MEC4852881.1 helix-turn-helix domain-containing protein [Jaaginema sp. PMC 1079.18]MEC4868230.1 helix-turn-helix domain-containing protein [Jaaginema sp. PMC 1078.18]
MVSENRDRPKSVLKQRLRQIGFTTIRQFRDHIDVTPWQIQQLQQGKIEQMRLESLLKLAKGLQWSLEELIAAFSDQPDPKPNDLQQECDRLQQQLQQQQEQLQREFETTSLRTLETWLRQWSAITHAIHKNPNLPASRVLPFLEPIEQLVKEWGVEAIASVGEEINYDPQWHQLRQGIAQPGTKVRVTHTGYLHHGKLLYRAQVKLSG